MVFSIKKEKLSIIKDIFSNLIWVLSILKNYRGRLFIYMLLLVLIAIYQIFLTSKMGNVIDIALSDNVADLVKNSVVLVFMYSINVLIGIASDRISAVNFNSMYNDLNLMAYSKIMDSSWEELTEYHTGDLITRLTADVKSIALNTCRLIPSVMSKLILILLAGLYILHLDYTLIIVALIVAPIVLIASRMFAGKVYASHVTIKRIESNINSYNKETFNNIHAVKAFNLGKVFYSRMVEMEADRKDADLDSNKYSLLSILISFMTEIIGGFICVGWMYFRVHSGVISFGSLTVMAFLAYQIGSAIKGTLNMVPDMMEYMASTERIKKIVLLSDESDSNEITENISDSLFQNGVSIHIEDMHFKYRNGYSVFEGANLEAKPGEIIALVGPSGEGKTTMLRIILGIVSCVKGNAYAMVSEQRINLGKQTRSIISYVPQGNTMMAGSILDNMRLIKRDATEAEIISALKTANIFDFVSLLPDGLNHKLGESGLGFSEGQNQRLSIARALLKNSPVLLMDEATSALDVATERIILSNIIKKDPNKTIILTTHRPTVLSMCDRVYRISDKTVRVVGEEDIKQLIDEF